MQVYAIFDVSDPDRVQEGIRKHYPEHNYIGRASTFFIATRGETSQQVAKNLGVSRKAANTTSGVVVLVTKYWGHYQTDLWDWINANQTSS